MDCVFLSGAEDGKEDLKSTDDVNGEDKDQTDVSVTPDSPSKQLPDQISFFSGNPSVEIVHGIMHLYKTKLVLSIYPSVYLVLHPSVSLSVCLSNLHIWAYLLKHLECCQSHNMFLHFWLEFLFCQFFLRNWEMKLVLIIFEVYLLCIIWLYLSTSCFEVISLYNFLKMFCPVFFLPVLVSLVVLLWSDYSTYPRTDYALAIGLQRLVDIIHNVGNKKWSTNIFVVE